MPDRILLISYCFPPMTVPEAMLSAKRMGALEGYEVDVVCAAPFGGWRGGDRSLDPYVRARFGEVTRVSRTAFGRRARFGRFTGIARPPDDFRLVNGPARRAAHKILRRGGYAAIVSWSQPHSGHLVARSLARRHGLPWLAHMSDPWVRNPFLSLSPLERRLNERLERKVFAGANRLLFTSEQTVELCMAGYPDQWRERVRVLPHAFDHALYGRRPPAGSSTGGRLVLRYLGAFYGPRSPSPLVAALRRLEQSTLVRLCVEIVGSVEEGMLDTPEIRALPPGTLVARGAVGYLDSLREMEEADGLLVVDAPAQSSPFLPSKLVDYVGARRPIAALTPPGAAADLTRRVGGVVADPADPEAGAAALTRLVALIDSLGDERFGDAAVRSEYDVEVVGRRMAALLDEVIAGRG